LEGTLAAAYRPLQRTAPPRGSSKTSCGNYWAQALSVLVLTKILRDFVLKLHLLFSNERILKIG